MIPGEHGPDRVALIAALEHLAVKPTDFTFADISATARLALMVLNPPAADPQRVVGQARRSDGMLVTWEQTEITDHLD